MEIESRLLLEQLLQKTEEIITTVNEFKKLPMVQLQSRKNPKSWNALECLEHLNRYGEFYIPEIEKRILAQKKNSACKIFKGGLLGNYFANLMSVHKKDKKIFKMKTFHTMNPLNSSLNILTIEKFLKQQNALKLLLYQATLVDLTKTKTSISLTSLIKLRLGDTFRFYINHIERHVLQAQRAIRNE